MPDHPVHPVQFSQVIEGERCLSRFHHCPKCNPIRCRLTEGHKGNCIYGAHVPEDHPVFRTKTASYTINVYDWGDSRSPEDWREDGRWDTLLDVAMALFPDNDVDSEGVLK